MGVILHGVPNDIGHLVEPAIVHPFHGMQDAPLDRFQSVNNMRHSTFKDHIGGIINEIVLIHPCKAGDLSHPPRSDALQLYASNDVSSNVCHLFLH